MKRKTTEKPTIGALGESLACRYLEERGFAILERNYRKIWGELDIIAKKDGLVHFVEVKTVSRESSAGISPADNLHERKVQRLRRAAASYAGEHYLSEDRWQMDAVLVVVDTVNRLAKAEWIESIG